MKNTTFCVLLAAMLMLMGAAISAYMKVDRQAKETSQVSGPANEPERREIMMPVDGAVVEPFGAKYSAEYGQWSLSESIFVAVNEAQPVRAPMDCTVEAIEALDGGGSCVSLKAGNEQIKLRPVYNLGVFVGSRLQAGAEFATARDMMEICMERDGLPVDPEDELMGSDAGE